MRIAVVIAVLASLVLSACSAAPRPLEAPARPTSSGALASTPPDLGTPAPKAVPEGIAWVAITHPRRDVYELSLDQLRDVLTGRIRDWSGLGGAPGSIEAYVPTEDAADVASALGIADGTAKTTAAQLTASRRSPAEIIELVRAEPRALAVVRPEALTPDVLALVVQGHDPLGDPASRSPLRMGVLAREFDPVLVVSPGEILPVRCANAALEAHGDYGVMFEDVAPLLKRADIAIGGLDTPLTDVSPPTPCESTFTLQGSPRAAEAIAGAGIDLLFVNGNHMFDCWVPCPPYAALRDTLARLQRLGVRTAGAGENLREARRAVVIEAGAGKPMRFAFLAYDEIAPWNWATEGAPGTAPLKRETVIEDVRAAKANADIVIVGMSWGIEYTPDPNANQRDLAAAAIEAGATLIVGNHPHVVEAIERRNAADGRQAFVIYAQGNYIFDQSWSVPTTQAVLLEAGFADGRLIGYRLRPVVTRGKSELRRGLYRPELVPPAGPEGREILGRIWDAQDRLPR